METPQKGHGHPHAEDDYEAHKSNPSPSHEAIEEKDDRPAGNTIKWVIFIAIVALIIVYFIMR